MQKPKNPQQNPNPKALEVSVSRLDESFNLSFSKATFKSS